MKFFSLCFSRWFLFLTTNLKQVRVIGSAYICEHEMMFITRFILQILNCVDEHINPLRLACHFFKIKMLEISLPNIQCLTKHSYLTGMLFRSPDTAHTSDVHLLNTASVPHMATKNLCLRDEFILQKSDSLSIVSFSIMFPRPMHFVTGGRVSFLYRDK